MELDTVSLKQEWETIPVYIRNPIDMPADFIWLAPRDIAFSEATYQKVRRFLDPVGEALPLDREGDPYYVLNLIYRADCMDEENTKRKSKTNITKIAFHPEKLAALPHSIFMVPQCRTYRFALERTDDPETEFLAFIDENNLTGLKFHLVWSDDPDDVIPEAAYDIDSYRTPLPKRPRQLKQERLREEERG